MMADEEDDVLHLPARLTAMLGITEATVEQCPPYKYINDKMLYGATDASRKNLVGVEGTNLQMIEALDGNEDGYVMGQVCLYLVKNRIKPMARDVLLLVPLVQITAEKLGEGDIHAVNRRSELTDEGVLKPTGDDIVPDAVRDEWLGNGGGNAVGNGGIEG
jgi:hypothetical protein